MPLPPNSSYVTQWNPKIFDGYAPSYRQIRQGRRGNCWWLASLIAHTRSAQSAPLVPTVYPLTYQAAFYTWRSEAQPNHANGRPRPPQRFLDQDLILVNTTLPEDDDGTSAVDNADEVFAPDDDYQWPSLLTQAFVSYLDAHPGGTIQGGKFVRDTLAGWPVMDQGYTSPIALFALTGRPPIELPTASLTMPQLCAITSANLPAVVSTYSREQFERLPYYDNTTRQVSRNGYTFWVAPSKTWHSDVMVSGPGMGQISVGIVMGHAYALSPNTDSESAYLYNPHLHNRVMVDHSDLTTLVDVPSGEVALPFAALKLVSNYMWYVKAA